MEGFPAVAHVRVRYSDEDNLGHVNNARYFTYLEEGRVEYLRRMGVTEPLPRWKEFIFVIAEAHIRYLAPAHYGEILRVGCRCTYLRSSAFGFEYVVTRAADGTRLATGWTRQVAVDPVEGRPTGMPGWVRERIEAVEGQPVPERLPEVRPLFGGGGGIAP